GNPVELPNSEDDPTRPLSPYAASKLAAEQYCQAFHATYGLEPVVLRYFNIFGPRQDPNSQYAAVVPRFITMALRGERPTIYGDGGQTRDFVYVANVVHANLLASRAPAAQVAGQVCNGACGGRSCSALPTSAWTDSLPSHAVEHLSELVQAEGLPQHRALRAQQLVPRLHRDGVAGRKDDAALPAASLLPQPLEQVEPGVGLVEMHIHDERVVAGRPGELPRGFLVPRH